LEKQTSNPFDRARKARAARNTLIDSERKQRREMIEKQTEKRGYNRQTAAMTSGGSTRYKLTLESREPLDQKTKRCRHSNAGIGTPSLRGVAACKINIESDKKREDEKKGGGTLRLHLKDTDNQSTATPPHSAIVRAATNARGDAADHNQRERVRTETRSLTQRTGICI